LGRDDDENIIWIKNYGRMGESIWENAIQFTFTFTWHMLI
jgi:hypothetical protein